MIVSSRNTLSRRDFAKTLAGLYAGAALLPAAGLAQDTAAALGAEDERADAKLANNEPQMRVLLHEANGLPLDKERARTLIVRDMAGDPLPRAILIAEGRARVGLASEPVQLGARLSVPDFGEVFCYADNQGRGYSVPNKVNFVIEAARTRLKSVREALISARREGFEHDPELERLLEAAGAKIPSSPGDAQLSAAYKRLADGLHAGERLALLRAKRRISKLQRPRTEFLFGCLGSGWQRGAAHDKAFTSAFNFAATSWYSWNQNPEPSEKRIIYDRQDGSLEWCRTHSVIPKGFGYVYMARGATPEWIRDWPFEKLIAEYSRVVEQTLHRYDGRWPYVEVINEAHDKANLFRLSHAQILEMTREACAAAKRGSAKVKRVINHCCLWAEYAKRRNADGSRRWSPFSYLQDCIKSGVDFEVIGLQLYYPQHDLFEIDRMLERFKVFRKPIHITEMACNSSDGLDSASMRPNSKVPGWHGPWSESIQADWLESMYTLCYSKPEFQAVGWWDLADVGGHFWPHGGLMHKDFTPKESYNRLLSIKRGWGLRA